MLQELRDNKKRKLSFISVCLVHYQVFISLNAVKSVSDLIKTKWGVGKGKGGGGMGHSQICFLKFKVVLRIKCDFL